MKNLLNNFKFYFFSVLIFCAPKDPDKNILDDINELTKLPDRFFIKYVVLVDYLKKKEL
jgi:hypothetical protein